MADEKSICSACKAEIEGTPKFCPECGANLEELRKAEEFRKAEEARKAEEVRLAQEAAQAREACKCPKCGSELQMNAKFCPKCGARQDEEKTVHKEIDAFENNPVQDMKQNKNNLSTSKITFKKAVASCFRQTFGFKGRATRSEFWYFFLFSLIAFFVFNFIYVFIAIYQANPYLKPAVTATFNWVFSLRYLCLSLQYNCFARPGFELVLPYFINIAGNFLPVDIGLLTIIKIRFEDAIFYIPWLAVSVRRLHDTNHSGWWAFVPIVPLIFYFQDSASQENKWGKNPKSL